MLRARLIQDEEVERPFNASQFKRLMAYMKPHVKHLLFTLVIMVIAALCDLAGPYLLKVGIDNYMVQGKYAGLTVVALIFLSVNLIRMLCMRQRTRTMSVVGQKVLTTLRKDLFTHIQSLSFSYYDSRPAGKILVRIINDVNSLGDLLSNGIINLVIDLFTLVVVMAIMMSIHFRLALVAMITVPITAIVVMLLKKHIRFAWQVVRKKNSNMNAYLHESLAGMRVTQAFTRESETRKVYHQLSEDIRSTWMRAVGINYLLSPAFEIIGAIGTVLVYIFGLNFLDEGTVTVGILVAFLNYVWRFWHPLNNLCNFYNSLLVAMASTERIFETLDEKPDIHDEGDAIDMPEIKGEVQFEHVDFSYDPEKPVLKDVSFTVRPGETIALVGPTGAGKSTIVNLISRFYDPVSGAVKVDGMDIRDVKLESLRKQMGVMLQDSFIFSGTIMDNIRYGKLDASDEEVMEAARIVHADTFIRDMEDGYNTEVKERGSRLSHGQKQLISFARALLANPRILILDEATSSIDTQTELLVQKGLEQLLKGRTSFVIAHRLSTIRNASRIMVVDQGKIMECGSHDELIEQKGIYYELYQAQYKYLEAV
jgi:ATP-binding cassette subfamily B multidrug efflux pump